MASKLSNLGGTKGAVAAAIAMFLALGVGAYLSVGQGLEQATLPSTEQSANEPIATGQTSIDQTSTGQEEIDQTQVAPAPVVAEPAPNEQTAMPDQTTSVIAAGPDTSGTSDQAVDATAPAALQSPSFDEVRREPDGTTVFAGRAAPLSEVVIIVDGQQIATAQADRSGGFAAIAVIPPQGTAQVVSLSARDGAGGGQTALSQEEIILAPTVMAALPATAALVPNSDEAAASQQQAAAHTAAPSVQDKTEPSPSRATPVPPTGPARVALLKSDADGVRLLNPERPVAMTSIALDTIGYSDAGDVQLAGRAQADTAQVRVYLDNRVIVDLPVDAAGQWQGDLPDVDEGVYTLRVDELDQNGDVSSRVETPFKRESAQTLAQAAGTEGPIKSITVQTGATLWAIARDRYGDGTLYVRVFEANAASIRDPDLIYPGQVFDLPN